MKEINVADDTLVVFNGDLCYWGDLSHNERMLCEMDSDLGIMMGSDPFSDITEVEWGPDNDDTE